MVGRSTNAAEGWLVGSPASQASQAVIRLESDYLLPIPITRSRWMKWMVQRRQRRLLCRRAAFRVGRRSEGRWRERSCCCCAVWRMEMRADGREASGCSRRFWSLCSSLSAPALVVGPQSPCSSLHPSPSNSTAPAVFFVYTKHRQSAVISRR